MNHSIVSLILRLGFSSMMITHGYRKFLKLINGDFGFADPFGIGAIPSLVLAVFGEFICPILLIIGYKTKLAAIPPAITMLVAFFFIHLSDPFKKQELALMYFVGFVAVYLLGPGKYSLDWRLKKI